MAHRSAILFLIALSFAGCRRSPPRPELVVSIAQSGQTLLTTLTNHSHLSMELVNKPDPAYSVFQVRIVDANGKEMPYEGGVHDWWIFGPDGQDVHTFLLEPGEARVLQVPLSDYRLPPGAYRARVTYSAGQDDFWVDIWLKRRIRGGPEFKLEMLEKASLLWFGTAHSNEIELRIAKPEARDG